jgi:hypothetical protein
VVNLSRTVAADQKLRFDDDGPDGRLAGVAKGQQEVGHASGGVIVSLGGKRMASTAGA